MGARAEFQAAAGPSGAWQLAGRADPLPKDGATKEGRTAMRKFLLPVLALGPTGDDVLNGGRLDDVLEAGRLEPDFVRDHLERNGCARAGSLRSRRINKMRLLKMLVITIVMMLSFAVDSSGALAGDDAPPDGRRSRPDAVEKRFFDLLGSSELGNLTTSIDVLGRLGLLGALDRRCLERCYTRCRIIDNRTRRFCREDCYGRCGGESPAFQ
jgi:hypothetical protein